VCCDQPFKFRYPFILTTKSMADYNAMYLPKAFLYFFKMFSFITYPCDLGFVNSSGEIFRILMSHGDFHLTDSSTYLKASGIYTALLNGISIFIPL
jgi:hypothetical protein